jgi:aminoglycoside/choline kinase family phosphotransferase/CTP:molybdopterin cytidylyltransferase MocA
MTEPHDGLRGLVLAAGYGTRLQPLTDLVPKPLLPVGGRALLDLAIANLDRAGVGPIAVNSHHLGDQVAAHLRARPDATRFTLSPEPEILGTGGALDGARAFLAHADTILLHNGDVLTDADLRALLAEHRRTGAVATLLLVDHPAVNTVEVAADGAVVRLAGRPAPTAGAGMSAIARRLTYSGVGVFARRLLDDVPSGPSSLVDVLARLIAREPGAVRAWSPPGVAWDDVGTFARWLGAQADDAAPAAAIAGAPAPAVTIERIRGHGSDRRFWRLARGDWRAVAMAGTPGDPEHARFVALAAFLAAHDLGPAAILRHDDDEKLVLMEDLGRGSLYALAGGIAADEPAAVRAWELATDHVARLQAVTGAARAECPVAFELALDASVLRWETGYFSERFLGGLMALDATALTALTPGFTALAETVAAQPRHLLHRDYQSQNLLVKAGRLRLVDFQGLRPGPLGYDLASLLWDPYVSLTAARREALLERYAARVRESLDPAATAADVRAMVLAAALQRLMQALGAYGFLSLVKGRRGFLAHVPRGLAHLRDVLRLSAAARAAGQADPRRLPPALPELEALLAGLDDRLVAARLAAAAAAAGQAP